MNLKPIKVEAPDFVVEKLRTLLRCKEQIRELEMQIKEIKNDLMSFLGDAASLTYKGNVIAEQEFTETTSFNVSKLYDDYPYLVEQLINVRPIFKLNINYDLLNNLLSEEL